MGYFNKRLLQKDVQVRDFSEPIRQETTGYGERIFTIIDFDPVVVTGEINKIENEYIKTYRTIALNPYIDWAVEDVVNEILSIDEENPYPIQLQLDDVECSDNIKKKIQEEWKYILRIMEFGSKAPIYLSNWYIDGKTYFYVEYHDNVSNGIKAITMLDPLRTKRVWEGKGEDKKEMFVHATESTDGMVQQTLMIDPTQMVEANCGLMDEKKRIYISYLHKAIKPLNQLSSIEDALVIYRISRAPERRVFYVDVGELPKTKAEAYMKELIASYRNKMEYDPTTGAIKEKTRHSSLLEDVWLPRRDGNRGTEVSTLGGGQNLGEITDVDYFLRKLFRSLCVPYSRWMTDSGGAFSLGRPTEITRDEVKYSKFISKLRMMYNKVFVSLLRKQVLAKKIVTPEEFDEMSFDISFIYNSDTMFSEFKELDVWNERLNILEKVQPFIGKFYSMRQVNTEILKRTDEEIDEIMKQIEDERSQMEPEEIEAQDNMYYDGQLQAVKTALQQQDQQPPQFGGEQDDKEPPSGDEE